MPSGLGDKSTRDLLTLMIGATVCAALLLFGAGLLVLAILRPEVDTSEQAGRLAHGVTILAGVVVGYVGGKRDAP